MAGICSLAYIGERKKLCHSFGKAVDLLLAVCMLVQEVADMFFHLALMDFQKFLPVSESDLVMFPHDFTSRLVKNVIEMC